MEKNASGFRESVDVFDIKNRLAKKAEKKGEKILSYYKKLISLKKNKEKCAIFVKVKFSISEETKLLAIQELTSSSCAVMIANFSNCEGKYRFPCPEEEYVKVLDSADNEWDGPGSVLPSQAKFNDKHKICPLSVAVYIISEKAKKVTEKFICIHGHFYQPPRENPWLEEVEFEESAYPYHDWNTRITAECYAPNSVARIMDSQWRVIGIVNNYSKISLQLRTYAPILDCIA